ncbi:MAG: UDP-N-acetylglucosamine--N-acetylmuramyl-(pentapeptide) pyrophosphoryl-undecaprenol N-acetylglucosamine transferase [Planctomycetota bacterium]
MRLLNGLGMVWSDDFVETVTTDSGGNNMNESPHILFAGGGTAGHLMPGAAVARALQRTDSGAECLFLTTGRDAERICAEELEGFRSVPVPAARWKGVVQKLRFCLTAPAAAGRTFDIVRDFGPDMVVGLGGYSCICPTLTARGMGCRTMVFESNAIPGRVTRLLAPLVDAVQLQWAEAARHMRACRCLVTGNPVRERVLDADRAAALREFGLDTDRLTVLVMGGSQGALPLNRMLRRALTVLRERPPAEKSNLQILHITGPNHLEEARKIRVPSALIYRPLALTPAMGRVYAASDVAFCRAGGSSLAELTAVGLPSLLVPLPHARDDHQKANAAVLEREGAAKCLSQDELTPGRLARLIVELGDRPGWLRQMGEEAHRIGRPDAARKVARHILAMARLKSGGDPGSGPDTGEGADSIVNSLSMAA